MTEHDFCMWLQGFAEINGTPPTQEQWQAIREHLQTVFKKVTPPVGAPYAPIKNGEEIKKLLERAIKPTYNPVQPPVSPEYFLDRHTTGRKPGEIYC